MGEGHKLGKTWVWVSKDEQGFICIVWPWMNSGSEHFLRVDTVCTDCLLPSPFCQKADLFCLVEVWRLSGTWINWSYTEQVCVVLEKASLPVSLKWSARFVFNVTPTPSIRAVVLNLFKAMSL